MSWTYQDQEDFSPSDEDEHMWSDTNQSSSDSDSPKNDDERSPSLSPSKRARSFSNPTSRKRSRRSLYFSRDNPDSVLHIMSEFPIILEYCEYVYRQDDGLDDIAYANETERDPYTKQPVEDKMLEDSEMLDRNQSMISAIITVAEIDPDPTNSELSSSTNSSNSRIMGDMKSQGVTITEVNRRLEDGTLRKPARTTNTRMQKTQGNSTVEKLKRDFHKEEVHKDSQNVSKNEVLLEPFPAPIKKDTADKAALDLPRYGSISDRNGLSDRKEKQPGSQLTETSKQIASVKAGDFLLSFDRLKAFNERYGKRTVDVPDKSKAVQAEIQKKEREFRSTTKVRRMLDQWQERRRKDQGSEEILNPEFKTVARGMEELIGLKKEDSGQPPTCINSEPCSIA